MPTIVTCHNCGQRFQAEDFLAGQQIGCPKCGSPLQIPALETVSHFAAPGSSPVQAGVPHTTRMGPSAQQQGSGVNQRLVVVACSIGGGAVVLLLLFMLIGSLFSSNGESSPNAAPGPSVERPQGLLVYQPALIWANEEVSYQGTGFIAATPQGQTVGVTSAHFVEFNGPKLLAVVWTDIHSGEPLFRFSSSLGQPGRAGRQFPFTDLRTDYFILVSDDPLEGVPVLELDPREHPAVGERVWLPNKDDSRPEGYVMLEGTVTNAGAKYSEIVFKPSFVLQSQSGSPLISQSTGKVIGTLTSGGPTFGGISISIAPSRSILDAMNRAAAPLPLHTVVGH